MKVENYILSDNENNMMLGAGQYIGAARSLIRILPPMSNTQAKLVFLPLAGIDFRRNIAPFDNPGKGLTFKAIDFIYAAQLADETVCKCSNLDERISHAKKTKGSMKACYNPQNPSSMKYFMEELLYGEKDEIGKYVGGVAGLITNPDKDGKVFSLFKSVSYKDGIVTLVYSEEFLPYISEMYAGEKITAYGTVNVDDFRKLSAKGACMWYLLAAIWFGEGANRSISLSTRAIFNFLGLKKKDGSYKYQHMTKSIDKDGQEIRVERLNRKTFEDEAIIKCFEDINSVSNEVRFKHDENGSIVLEKKKKKSETSLFRAKDAKHGWTVESYEIKWTKKSSCYKFSKIKQVKDEYEFFLENYEK